MRWAARGGLALAVVGALLLAGTPVGRYLARAAWEEGRILARRRPIARLVREGGVDAATRGKLALVLDARRFAAESLGLDAGRSFTRFTDLGRDTLVVVVSAARRDTLAAHRWWFPVVGWVPYKGFFHVADARREAAALRRRGLDTALRTASAFSTLGWFEDPLMSTTLAADSVDLANTVIHELTHNTFYAPGEATFNESFASFVGAHGAIRFFGGRGDTASVRRAATGWADQQRLGAFWAAFAAAVDSAYAAHPGQGAADSLARVRARDTVEARARATLAREVAPRLLDVDPRRAAAWTRRVELNNAALLARLTYARDLPLFDRVLAREGGRLTAAIDRIVALARARPEDPFGALRDWLAGRAVRAAARSS